MEGERRKRKQENNEEESEEEEKLEKFLALIRSTKDVRDRLYNTKEKQDKKDVVEEKDKGIWKPTFQPEDFIDCHQQGFRSTHNFSNPTAPSPSSTCAKHDDVMQVADKQPPEATASAPPPPQTEDDEKASDHLDLNLSL